MNLDTLLALYHAGAIVPVIILAAYYGGSWAGKHIAWLEVPNRAHYLAIGLGGLAVLVPSALQGTTPNAQMLLGAVAAAILLVAPGIASKTPPGSDSVPVSPPAPATMPNGSGPSVVKRVALAMVCALFLTDVFSCAAFDKDVKAAGTAIVDCTKSGLVELLPIASVLLAFVTGGTLSLPALEADALAMGGDIGGCLEGDINDLLKPTTGSGSAAAPAALAAAQKALSLDTYRAKTGSTAKYKTAHATY